MQLNRRRRPPPRRYVRWKQRRRKRCRSRPLRRCRLPSRWRHRKPSQSSRFKSRNNLPRNAFIYWHGCVGYSRPILLLIFPGDSYSLFYCILTYVFVYVEWMIEFIQKLPLKALTVVVQDWKGFSAPFSFIHGSFCYMFFYI